MQGHKYFCVLLYFERFLMSNLNVVDNGKFYKVLATALLT